MLVWSHCGVSWKTMGLFFYRILLTHKSEIGLIWQVLSMWSKLGGCVQLDAQVPGLFAGVGTFLDG